jgi:hypothetical protein
VEADCPSPSTFFLWLVSHNKSLTQENLEKRRAVDDMTCLFCNERESVNHLLFECVVAHKAWGVISAVLGFDIRLNYESIAKRWLCNTKFGIANVINLAVCWGLWKLRKILCFQEVPWCSTK